MDLSYPTNRQEINSLLDTIDIHSQPIIINNIIVIYSNGLVKLRHPPPLELLHVLTHPNLKAIMSVNLNIRIVSYLEKLKRSIDTIIINNIEHLANIERILHRNHIPSSYPFTKIHYNGYQPTKSVSLLRINSVVSEMVIPLLDNIEDVINLNPNLKVIGVYGEAYHLNDSPHRIWYQLLNLIKRKNKITFVLFFTEEYLPSVTFKDLPNLHLATYSAILTRQCDKVSCSSSNE